VQPNPTFKILHPKSDVPVVSSTYSPPRLLSGGHLQTLFATLARRVDFAYDRRERIATPDDDFLDLDWAYARVHGEPERRRSDRVAVLTHGLEGSADRSYMRGMARVLVRRGWDVCAWNLRGCSGEPNRRVPTYHSGKTEDLATVVGHVLPKGYDVMGLVGFSLGGNMTLKYLGERGRGEAGGVDARIRRAAVFSVPVDLGASARQISSATNWHYSRYFLRSLRETIRVKVQQHPDVVSAEPFEDIRTLRDFDDVYTAPLNGFRSAADYYAQASSKPFLSDLPVPTLLVNAANDPFLADSCYPDSIARTSDRLTLEVPDSGGHVGFVAFNDAGEYWSEQRAAGWLDG